MARTLLVCGTATSGKTTSLKSLENQEKVLYLNCESAKGLDLPFRNKFMKRLITDPEVELKGAGSFLDQARKHSDKIDIVVIDSLTMCMRTYENKYVKTAPNTQQAWGAYADFVDNLLNQEIATLPQTVIVTAHVGETEDKKTFTTETKALIKGSVGKVGVEAYFNNIVSCKRLPVEWLKANYKNDLLTYTEKEEALGFKHVIQTQLTKDTCSEKLRSNEDMWTEQETFINGDIQLVLNRLKEYYGE